MSVNPLQKGNKVVMHTSMEAEVHDGQIWTCAGNEFKHHPNHDYTVIMLDGYSGSFQTMYLQKVKVPQTVKAESTEKSESVHIKDVNGVIMRLGDIIQDDVPSYGIIKYHNDRFLVTSNHNGKDIHSVKSADPLDREMVHDNNMRVIGNINEHDLESLIKED